MKYLKLTLALALVAIAVSITTACSSEGDQQFKLAAVVPAGNLEAMAPQAVTLEADDGGKASLLIEVSTESDETNEIALAVESIEGSATSGDLIIPRSDTARGTSGYASSINAQLDVRLVPGKYYITVDGVRAPVDITVVKHGAKPSASVAD